MHGATLGVAGKAYPLGEEVRDMQQGVVEPISRALLQGVLEETDLKYMVDKDGDFVLLIGDEKARATAIVVIALQGPRKQILTVMARVENTPSLSRADWLEKVNLWNAKKRWPRAFLAGDRLTLDFHLNLEKGVHRELLKDIILTVLAGISQFLVWIEGRDPEAELGERLLRELLRRLQEE